MLALGTQYFCVIYIPVCVHVLVYGNISLGCVVKARRNSKVHFRVSQEIRVMPCKSMLLVF